MWYLIVSIPGLCLLTFLLKLKNEDWDVFYSSLCVIPAWSSFRNIFINVIDTFAPIKIKDKDKEALFNVAYLKQTT